MEAAKQCNRGIIPKVEYPINFKDAVDTLPNNGFKYYLMKRKNLKG